MTDAVFKRSQTTLRGRLQNKLIFRAYGRGVCSCCGGQSPPLLQQKSPLDTIKFPVCISLYGGVLFGAKQCYTTITINHNQLFTLSFECLSPGQLLRVLLRLVVSFVPTSRLLSGVGSALGRDLAEVLLPLAC